MLKNASNKINEKVSNVFCHREVNLLSSDKRERINVGNVGNISIVGINALITFWSLDLIRKNSSK
jgi:hypothetical protein